MKVAVIADIHGNCFALDAVLADLDRESVDRIICLGDAIQGGAQPAETVARLRTLDCPVVMGNADAFLLSGHETGTETISERLRVTRLWSLAQLTDADRAFISGFQPTVTVPLVEGRDLLCFHGSPASFDDIILPETSDEEFRRLLDGYAPSILTGGHTHLQQLRRIGDAFFFNPGSVGFAYRHHQAEADFRADPWANYALLSAEGDRLGLDLRRVPLDVDALMAIIHASGMPDAAAIAGRYLPPDSGA